MKHVGLNVAADPLFTVSYTGVNGGLVVIVADDPGMHSSQNEQDSRFYARSAHVAMLEPSDSMEAKEYVKAAFDLSERFDTPVLVRSNTRLSHSQGMVELGEREMREPKPYQKNIGKFVMMPGMAKKAPYRCGTANEGYSGVCREIRIEYHGIQGPENWRCYQRRDI